MTRREQEMILVDTLLQSINEMRTLKSILKQKKYIPLFEDLDNYEYNISGIHSFESTTDFFNKKQPKTYPLSAINNDRGNYYGYLKKVSSFLNVYEPSVVSELNESLQPIDNPINHLNSSTTEHKVFDIDGYKKKLSNTLKLLENIDEPKKFRNQKSYILKTKILFNLPIMVYGFSINNLEQLSKSSEIGNILSAYYSPLRKELIAVGKNKSIVYSIMEDVYQDIKTLNSIEQVKQYTGFNDWIYVILPTQATQNLKFTDNLYQDNLLNTYRANMIQKSRFVRQ
jgi:hypothetical protein